MKFCTKAKTAVVCATLALILNLAAVECEEGIIFSNSADQKKHKPAAGVTLQADLTEPLVHTEPDTPLVPRRPLSLARDSAELPNSMIMREEDGESFVTNPIIAHSDEGDRFSQAAAINQLEAAEYAILDRYNDHIKHDHAAVPTPAASVETEDVAVKEEVQVTAPEHKPSILERLHKAEDEVSADIREDVKDFERIRREGQEAAKNETRHDRHHFREALHRIECEMGVLETVMDRAETRMEAAADGALDALFEIAVNINDSVDRTADKAISYVSEEVGKVFHTVENFGLGIKQDAEKEATKIVIENELGCSEQLAENLADDLLAAKLARAEIKKEVSDVKEEISKDLSEAENVIATDIF